MDKSEHAGTQQPGKGERSLERKEATLAGGTGPGGTQTMQGGWAVGELSLFSPSC